jgi:hypothetical protein
MYMDIYLCACAPSRLPALLGLGLVSLSRVLCTWQILAKKTFVR